MLQSYEKQKRIIKTNTHSQINNENHNINKPLNTQRNRDNNRGRNDNKRGRDDRRGDGRGDRRGDRREDRRGPAPSKARITVGEFERQFGDLTKEEEGAEKKDEEEVAKKKEEELAGNIAAFLDEKNVGLILATLVHLGTKETLRFVRETAEREEGGGVMTANQNRQRSPGGCFFFLVKEGVKEDLRKAIFTDPRGKEFKKTLRKDAQAKNKKQPEIKPDSKKQNIKKQDEKQEEEKPTKQENGNENNSETKETNGNKDNITTEIEKTEVPTTEETDDQIKRIIEESLQT